jgi:hypothetical protein
MAHHKLVLEELPSDEFSLIAIHCSTEAYKMAFTLNKHLGLRLHRRRTDLDFSSDGLDVFFELYEFDQTERYTTFSLLANKCKTTTARTTASGSLFETEPTEEMVTKFLVPEFKKVDFFLKIETDQDIVPIRKYVSKIAEIKQVISAYEVSLDKLKSKNHLIYD